MVEFGKAPNRICCFSHWFVCLCFFPMENQKEEKGKRKIQINFFYCWDKKMNHFWMTTKLWSMTILSQFSVMLQLYPTTGEGIQESQKLVLSPLVPCIGSIIGLLQKKQCLKSWVPIFVHKQLFREDKLIVLVKYCHLENYIHTGKPWTGVYTRGVQSLEPRHAPVCHLCHQQHHHDQHSCSCLPITTTPRLRHSPQICV